MILYHNDHLGTPQNMTASNGAVVWSATYNSFGKAHVDPGSTVTNNLRFPGQYYDWETGLHYNWHRYYDQNLGRYLKIDPIGFLGRDLNLFAYVLNDPINLVDPWGLEFSDILPGIKTAVVEGAKGGTYAVGEAAKATADIAINGPPLAKTALGVAGLSITAPLAGATGIAVTPSVVSASYAAAPYSPIIVDAAYGFFNPGPPPQTPAGYGAWAARRILFGPSQKLFQDTLCK